MSPGSAELYRNTEFGFAIEIPRGFPTCRGDPSEHDDGLDIWLDGGPSECGGLDTRPFVSAIGEYNAGSETNPEAVARAHCRPSRGKILAAPRGLTVNGKHTATCRIDKADGWILVFVFAQAGVLREPFDDGTPAINYFVMLQTRPERFEADLTRFRAILKTFRLFKPEM